MKRTALRALATGMILLTAGCWLPDEYKGEIDVKSDSTYQASYTGKLTAVEVAAALAQHKFAEGDAGYTKAMNDEVAKARQDPGTKSIDPIGAGMVQATYATDGRLASGKLMYDLLGVQVAGNTVTIQSIDISEGNRKGISQQLKLKSQGDICIKTELKVVKSNADTMPGMLSSCYGWKLDALSGKRLMIVMEKPAA
jgi:hypothetical protein